MLKDTNFIFLLYSLISNFSTLHDVNNSSFRCEVFLVDIDSILCVSTVIDHRFLCYAYLLWNSPIKIKSLNLIILQIQIIYKRSSRISDENGMEKKNLDIELCN